MSLHISGSNRTYEGRDGLTHNFDVVDWSTKTKVGTSKMTPEELEQLKEQLKEDRKDLIERIQLIHPQYAYPEFQIFVIRGEGKTTMEWNTVALSDEGLSTDFLMGMQILLNRRAEFELLKF